MPAYECPKCGGFWASTKESEDQFMICPMCDDDSDGTITTDHIAFATLLRDMFSRAVCRRTGVKCKVVWKEAQWDSTDSTEGELFDMFRSLGTPMSIEFYT